MKPMKAPKGIHRPTMFIGSSTQGREVAGYIQLELERDVECTIWDQGVFGLSEGTLESLVEATRKFEFAALVLTPDDLVRKRNKTVNSPRDNVLFELGLFMGSLGRKRTFIVYCRDEQIDLPSDLAGVTAAHYSRNSKGNLQAALGTACTKIRRAIEEAESHAATDAERVVTAKRLLERGEFEKAQSLLSAVKGANQLREVAEFLAGLGEGAPKSFEWLIQTIAKRNQAELRNLFLQLLDQGGHRVMLSRALPHLSNMAELRKVAFRLIDRHECGDQLFAEIVRIIGSKNRAELRKVVFYMVEAGEWDSSVFSEAIRQLRVNAEHFDGLQRDLRARHQAILTALLARGIFGPRRRS